MQTGGRTLAMIVPQNFSTIARQEKPQKQNRGNSKKKHDSSLDLSVDKTIKSQAFSDFMRYLQKQRVFRKARPQVENLIKCKEYQEHEKFKLVQCELEIQESRINRSDLNSLKYLVFKLRHPGSKKKQDLQGPDMPGHIPDIDNEDNMSQGMDDEQEQQNLMKTAHEKIQLIFGKNDEEQVNNQNERVGLWRYDHFQRFQQVIQNKLKLDMEKGDQGKLTGLSKLLQPVMQAKERQERALKYAAFNATLNEESNNPFDDPQHHVEPNFQKTYQNENDHANSDGVHKVSDDTNQGNFGGTKQAETQSLLPPYSASGVNGQVFQKSFKTDSEMVNEQVEGSKKGESRSTMKDDVQQLNLSSMTPNSAPTLPQQIPPSNPTNPNPANPLSLLFAQQFAPTSASVLPPLKVPNSNLPVLPNKEQQETPRIDVKKDISINDKIKKKTATYQSATEGTQLGTNGMLMKAGQLDTIKDQEPSVTSTNKRNSFVGNTQRGSKSATKSKLSQKLLNSKSNISQEPSAIQQDMQSQPQNALTTEGAQQEEAEEEYEEEIYEDEEGEEFGEESYEEEGEESDLMLGNESEGLLKQNQSGSSIRINGLGGMQGIMKNSNQMTPNTAKWQESVVGPFGGDKDKRKKKHLYEKIVTHPKDKEHDEETCGSAYFKDCDFDDYEIRIREQIKKCEKRKLRQERRIRKQQMIKTDIIEPIPKSIDSDQEFTPHGDGSQAEGQSEQNLEGAISLDDVSRHEASETQALHDQIHQSAHTGGGGGSTADTRIDDDDDISEEQNQTTQMMKDDQENGDVSSVASSMYSQMRSYFTLRNSIDERFVPLSIRNLKNVATFVFLGLLVLNITQFAIQRQLFQQVNDNIQNIHHSESRVSHIIDINLRVQNLRFQNEGLLTPSFFFKVNRTQFVELQNEHLLVSSTALQDSQTSLSLATATFEEGIRMKINPNDVVLVYQDQTNHTTRLEFNIWESIVKIVVNAYELTSEPFSILTNSIVVRFVQENCLNSLLEALNQSTEAIIVATDQIRDSSLNLFLVLLIAVSCSLIISVGFLLPIISRAKRSKQEVLELFLHKKIEKGIDEQLKLCRWFIQKYQIRADTGAMGAIGEVDANDDHIGAAGQDSQMNDQDLKKEKEELYNMKKQKKKKKWRKLNINFGYLSLRLLLIVSILEMFYLVNYLISKTFMSEVSSLTSELRLLISREPLYMLVLLSQKELFYSNGTATILSMNVNDVLAKYHKELIEDEQSLLELFSQNINYHTDTYNTQFNALMFSSICDSLDQLGTYSLYPSQFVSDSNSTLNIITKAECEAFNSGILKKGLYSTVTKYLSSLKQIDSQFQLLRKPNETAKDYINDPKIIMSERTVDIFMKKIHEHLVEILEEDINQFFQKEYKQDISLFIVFLAYLFFIYFFVWRIFLANLLDELWKAKSMLSVLPIDMCFKIEEIRLFIYANSSSSKVK